MLSASIASWADSLPQTPVTRTACDSPHALLISTALLRLLRAEVIRLRTEQAWVEGRWRRASARADGAVAEIESLGQEVAALHDRDLANSDVIHSLRQRVAQLEQQSQEREELLSEKEELLSARHTGRSLQSTCAESSAPGTSRTSLGLDVTSEADESESCSDFGSECGLQMQELDDGMAALRLDLAEARVRADETLTLLESERHASALIKQHSTGAVERAQALELELARSTSSAAEAREAQRAAEAETRVLHVTISRAGWEHERTVQQVNADHRDREEASLRAALQSRRMAQRLDQAHSERAEWQRQEVEMLRERVAALEASGSGAGTLSTSVQQLLAKAALEHARGFPTASAQVAEVSDIREVTL